MRVQLALCWTSEPKPHMTWLTGVHTLIVPLRLRSIKAHRLHQSQATPAGKPGGVVFCDEPYGPVRERLRNPS
jgi:hypothetical protein